MKKPIMRIHNTETNEIVDREMTDDEFAIYENERAEIETIAAKKQTDKAAAEAKLAVLGLTADDLKALGL